MRELTPEQQAIFDELHQRHRRRAEHFFLGGVHGRGFGRHPRRGPPPPPEPPPDD